MLMYQNEQRYIVSHKSSAIFVKFDVVEEKQIFDIFQTLIYLLVKVT